MAGKKKEGVTTVDIRLTFEDDVPESIEVLRFIDQEARKLNTSGRAGYILQLATAAYLAQRKGDLSLIGMLIPQGIFASVQPQSQPQQEQQEQPTANDMIGDSDIEGMF